MKLFFSLRILKEIHVIFSFRYADQVAIGDEVLVQENDGLTPSKVINVTSSTMQGNYNPFEHCFY